MKDCQQRVEVGDSEGRLILSDHSSDLDHPFGDDAADGRTDTRILDLQPSEVYRRALRLELKLGELVGFNTDQLFVEQLFVASVVVLQPFQIGFHLAELER